MFQGDSFFIVTHILIKVTQIKRKGRATLVMGKAVHYYVRC